MSDSDPRTLSRVLSPGLLLVLATVVVSGVSNFVNFRAVQGTDVDAWIAVRNALVALMLVPMALLAGSGLRTRLSRRDWARLMTIGLVAGPSRSSCTSAGSRWPRPREAPRRRVSGTAASSSSPPCSR